MLIVTLTVDQLTEIIDKSVEKKLLQHLPPSPVRYVNCKETAAVLGISQPTLRRYTRNGLLNVNQLGKIKRYRQDEVEAALVTIKRYKGLSVA